MRTYRLLSLALTLLALPVLARGDDWPQWNGPDRNGASKEKGLLKVWPKDGPTLAWKFEDAGTGFSAPAVVGDTVYVLGARKADEFIIALDAGTGKEKWSAKIGPVYDWNLNQWSRGPNSTPSIDGELLYAVGSKSDVVCVNVKTQKVEWRKNLVKDFGGEVNDVGGGPKTFAWGFCGSPLVDGDQVIVTPGGKNGLLLALDKKTGATKWQSKDVQEAATYSSPIVATIGGVKQYIAMTQNGVVGVNAKDGAELWRYEKEEAYGDIVAPTPIVADDRVIISGWIGGLDCVKITIADKKFTAEKAYANNKLANAHGGIVPVDKYLYGSHATASWRCIELATGKVAWESKDFGFGAVAYADGFLYCTSQDKNEVALIKASPEKFDEVSRFTLPEKSKLRKPSAKQWTHPVIANGCLYLRDQELLFCYKIKP